MMSVVSSSRRRGLTIVEMTVVLAASAVIAAICLPVIARLYAAKQGIQRDIAWHDAVHRLGYQLRSDVRAANSATVRGSAATGDQVVILQNTAGEEIRYALGASHEDGRDDFDLRRTVVQGEKIARDGFAFPQGTSLQWSIDGDVSRLVTLRLEIPSLHLKQRPDRPLEIVARLAGDPWGRHD